MEKTYDPLYLDKWSFVQWKIMDIPTSFIWIIIFLMELLNMAVFRNYEVMLGQMLNYFV
jgi:hypothetical protein